MRESADAVVIIADVVLLVWRMQAVVGQAEAHQDRWDTEVGGEVSDDRDRTAGTREHRRLAKDVAESLRGHADCRMIGIHHESRTGAQHANLALNAAWGILFHPLLERANYLLRVLT